MLVYFNKVCCSTIVKMYLLSAIFAVLPAIIAEVGINQVLVIIPMSVIYFIPKKI